MQKEINPRYKDARVTQLLNRIKRLWQMLREINIASLFNGFYARGWIFISERNESISLRSDQKHKNLFKPIYPPSLYEASHKCL